MAAKPRAEQPTARAGHWTRGAGMRRIFRLCRSLHVYTSAAMLGLTAFFAVTGLVLNHPGWVDGRTHKQEARLPLPADLAAAAAETRDVSPALLEAFVAETWGLQAPRNLDLDLQLGEAVLDYPLPAGYALAIFDLGAGTVTLERHSAGLVTLLNDLHKGRHSGPQWAWVIDLSAVFMLFFAFTGLVILWQQAKWRVPGLVLGLAGLFGPWLVYLIWVPR